MKQDKITQLSSYLAASGDYISGEELSTLLHTTTRTIRNYVFEINSSSEGESLILTSRKGYRWNIPSNSMHLISHSKKNIPHSPDERTSYIIRQLLYRKIVPYDTLLDKLMISSYTLDSDLTRIKGILRPFFMTLHHRKNTVYLEGRQMDRRRLIVNTILKTENISCLTMEFLDNVFPDIPAAEISQILNDIFPDYGLSGTGEMYYELILHIIVQMEQIRAGSTIIQDEFSLSDLEAYPDYECAASLAEKLELLSGCMYSHLEREYLALLLLAKAEDNYPFMHDIPSSASALRQSAVLLVTRLGRYLHTDFSQDSFTVWLSMYLQRMIIRQKLQLSRPSKLRSKMRSTYPTLYELTANFLFDFSKKTGDAIRSDEVCRLSMILASYVQDSYVFEASIPCSLLLPVDQSLAENIRSQLSTQMGSVLDIRQILLQPDMEQISKDAQLVLSLIPSQQHPHCIQISPFPKSADFRRIYREILQIKMEGYITRLKIYIGRYLNDAHFIHSSVLKKRNDVIHCVCSHLLKEGIVSSEYEDALLELENFESSGFDNLVAVPFTAHPGVSRNCMFVITTENHIPWLSGKINLFFFLICRDPDSSDFRDLYDLLIKIFCHPHNVQKVAGSRSVHELLESLDQIHVKS